MRRGRIRIIAKLIQSHTLDTFYNLAVEEYLLNDPEITPPVLFLWRSEKAVVIGKNQNPWRESLCPLLQEEGGVLARRISGGGAVYHDTGNLNYAFFVEREHYRSSCQFKIILSALRMLGVDARMARKNSIAVDGLKVSGNAFCLRKNRALHHGTLLIDSDLDHVRKYLSASANTFETRATRSIPAEVANLTRFASGIDRVTIAKALVACWEKACGQEAVNVAVEDLDQGPLSPLDHKHRSWNWRYGHTPPFHLVLDAESGLRVDVEKGCIVSVEGRSPDTAAVFREKWMGARFTLSLFGT